MTAINVPFGGGGGEPMSMASQGEWMWRAEVATSWDDIGPGVATCDADSPPEANHLLMWCDDVDGMDHSSMVESLKDGDSVFVYVKDNPDSWQQWLVRDTLHRNGEVWDIPVMNYAGSPSGTEPPTGTPCIFQFRDTASTPLYGQEGQVLTKRSDASGDEGWMTPDIATFQYTQMTPATSWPIGHYLGGFPTVTCLDSNGVWIIPEITYNDRNLLTLTFSAAVAGEAYLRR